MSMAKHRGNFIPEYPRLHFSDICRVQMQADLFTTFYGRKATLFYLGRGALWHVMKLLHLTHADKVLVPSYHCGVDIESILRADVGISYYRVKEDFTVDMEDLTSKIDCNSRAVVIMHYYGFPQPIESLKEFCIERKLFLIEDCAHALLSSWQGRALGTFGDVSIFSQRKSLPLPDGGAMLVNHPGIASPLIAEKPNLMVTLKKTIGMLFSSLNDASNNNVLLIPIRFMKKRISNLFQKNFGDTYSTAMDFDPSMGHLQMSNLSKRIMNGTKTDQVIEMRRRNFKYLLDNFSNSQRINKVHSSLPKGVCPLFFPIQIRGIKRQEVQDVMRQNRILTYVFGENLHGSLPENEFPEAEMLSREILCLPIHQDINKKDLNRMLNVIKSFS
jgi:perosamine synthetase